MILVTVVGTVLSALIVPRLGITAPSPRPLAVAPGPTRAALPSSSSPASPSPAQQQKLAANTASLVIDQNPVAVGDPPHLPWPDSGQAEVMIAGIGVLGHSGSTRPVPIASVAKVMTAYTVLRDHPLGKGKSGPTITVSAAEAAAYPAQKAGQESLIMVAPGEQLTEREALQGLLIASGDNVAEILARWDAGSVPAFVDKMNQNARRLTMTSTHYADPDGLSAKSVSTAHDLLTLAPEAMAQPAFAELVATTTASIPLNSRITNYNTLLGRHGVIGIKTGSTTAAGGCLLFAAHRKVSGHTVTIYGAVLGVSGGPGSILTQARDAGDALVVGAGEVLHRIVLAHAGEVVATVVDASGAMVNLTVAHDVGVTGWNGQRFRFALPRSLGVGQVPTRLSLRAPGKTLDVGLNRRS